jgi:hypothetical protein
MARCRWSRGNSGFGVRKVRRPRLEETLAVNDKTEEYVLFRFIFGAMATLGVLFVGARKYLLGLDIRGLSQAAHKELAQWSDMPPAIPGRRCGS